MKLSEYIPFMLHPVADLRIPTSRETEQNKRLQSIMARIVIIGALIGLYFTTYINYLVFHCLSELFSVVVAFSIFVIAWNSKKYIQNPYLVFIGIAYLFIALIDLLHTLSYKGMPLFTDYDYYANQLWIGARYMESLTLLIAFVFLRRDVMPRANLVFGIYACATALLFASIFYWKSFPVCFVEGTGLTPFKKISEYIICSILVAAFFLLEKNKGRFEEKVFRILRLSILFTIISELSFTLYTNNYGILNLVGHYFKIFSFMMIYDAIIKTGIEQPYNLIFLEIDRANRALKEEVAVRKSAEEEKEKLILSLKRAVEEIETLQGLLPICSICKNIRDDKGYWNGIDSYLSEHSELKFSHGLCPSCAEKHYQEYYISGD